MAQCSESTLSLSVVFLDGGFFGKLYNVAVCRHAVERFGAGAGEFIALAYPVYNRTLKKERKKITPEILRLTEELKR